MLRPVPITLRQANAFIRAHHRHLRPARGCLFIVGAEAAGQLVGVAVVGRPNARVLQDGYTAQVTRLCTDGAANVCSWLYARCRRVCQQLGYRKLLTYTLPGEGGASLFAAGLEPEGMTDGGCWDCPSRPREDGADTGPKVRWVEAF